LELTVFLAVLAAAVMHAGWNVLVKLKLDRFLSLFLLQTLMGLMGLAMLAVFAWPSAASLPYALTSGILHTGYNIFLARSYRTGDLSQVYPIARGTAPLLTLIVTFFAAHEAIGALTGLGIGVLVAGIWMTGLTGKRELKLDGLTLFFALGTSVFIAAYTVVDGLGGRASGSASGYAARARHPACRGALLEKRHGRSGAVGFGLLDRHLGHDAGGDRRGGGAARDQHPVRHSDVDAGAEGDGHGDPRRRRPPHRRRRRHSQDCVKLPA
jgi:drug/metabolite transporter (DMT)-like permease